MEETEIRQLVAALETSRSLEEEEVWIKLKPLGSAVLPYFLEYYPKMRKWQGRVSLLYHSIKWAQTYEDAFLLGTLALNDKATLVRYRACELLAFSLKKEAIPYLKPLLEHKDKETVQDAHAAIDAIKSKNHNYFKDRTHSGRVFWEVVGAETAKNKLWWHFW